MTKPDDKPKLLGRPPPPVEKKKRSLYLDEQVWGALESKRVERKEPSRSVTANNLLRESLNLDE